MNDFSDVYCEARFWRPTGLGNRLFSWARAKIFTNQTGCKMLSPEWAHLRGASITRGGIDYSNAIRKILLFDNFISAPDEIKGVTKLLLRKKCTVASVVTLQEAFNVSQTHGDKQLISFGGHTAHTFDELWIHREMILSSLKKITKKKWLLQADKYNQPFIGINVRMGNDYKKAVDMNDFLNKKAVYLQTPIDWYVQSLRKVREKIGSNFMAIIISDGTEHDLRVLLNEPNVILSNSKSAIGDLLTLAKAKLLFGAGGSSFSAWASFLAKVPTITIPGSNLQQFNVTKDFTQHYVGEFDPDNPSEAFYQSLNNFS